MGNPWQSCSHGFCLPHPHPSPLVNLELGYFGIFSHSADICAWPLYRSLTLVQGEALTQVFVFWLGRGLNLQPILNSCPEILPQDQIKSFCRLSCVILMGLMCGTKDKIQLSAGAWQGEIHDQSLQFRKYFRVRFMIKVCILGNIYRAFRQ